MDLSLPRRVEPELLDGLAAADPRAHRSRNDLRRIHRALATLTLIERALNRATAGWPPRTLLELGAGDGTLLARLAGRQSARWPGLDVTLLDQLDLVAPHTLQRLRAFGWAAQVVTADVFAWLEQPAGPGPDRVLSNLSPAIDARPCAPLPDFPLSDVALSDVAQPGRAHAPIARFDVVLANLFVHHFAGNDLRRLLAGIAARANVFICCEPRRAPLPLAGSHLLALLGAGPVTRQDAVASVHAGFRGDELSALWPERTGWRIDEYPAGLFSHCFVATRNERS